jgi:hypothetical protein
MSAHTYPRQPCELSLKFAKEIVGKSFTVDHKHINRMLATLRERKLDVELAYYGESSRDSALVVAYVADQNLRGAPANQIERKVASLQRKVGVSVASSLSKVDITRLGGPGAAGRQRDQARAGESRDIIRLYISRLQDELRRRASDVSKNDKAANT